MSKAKAINKDGKVVDLNGDEWERLQTVKEPETEQSKTDEIKAKSNGKPKPLRSRKFCCISYIETNVLEAFLSSAEWVQHFAIAYHDKDLKADGTLKPPHTHVVLILYDAKTTSSIRNHFDRLAMEIVKDTDNKPQNTTAQIMSETSAQWRYLIHADDPDKYQYDESVRICDEYHWWRRVESSYDMTCGVQNVGYQMYLDVLNGTPTRKMIERYGKEYIYHATHFKSVCADTFREESGALTNCDLLSKDLGHDVLNLLLYGSRFDDVTITAFWKVLEYLRDECTINRKSKLHIYLSDDEGEKK